MDELRTPVCVNEALNLPDLYAGRIKLSDVELDLQVYLGTKATYSKSTFVEEGLRASFENFYLHVVNEKPPKLSPYSVKRIIQMARDLGLDPKTVAATLVVAFSDSMRANNFSAYAATSSVDTVGHYADVCRSKFGFYDIRSIDVMFGTDLSSVYDEVRFLNSETRLCKLLTGSRAKGITIPVQDLIEMRELHFDPVWLAINPFYTRYVLEPYIKHDSDVSDALKDFRSTVSSIRSSLIRNRSRKTAAYYFSLRQSKLQKALKAALKKFGVSANDLFVNKDHGLEHPEQLYALTGKTLCHVECHRHLSGSSFIF